MSIIADLLSLAGQTPTPAASGERPDAAGFAGMLGAAGERPRGLMGLGRRLAEQAQAETARLDDGTPVVGVEPWILPGLLTTEIKPTAPQINPGPDPEIKPAEPLVNPGVVADKGDGPLINPGVQGKVDGALINPGSGIKDGQPLVNPGEAVAKDGVQILPGEAPPPAPVVAEGVLEVLALAGQAVRADAAAAAVRQAVGRAPETSTTPQTVEAVSTDVEIETPVLETAPAVAPASTASVSAASAGAGGASATSSAQAGPVEQAAARPEAERTSVEAAPANDVDLALAEAEVAPLPGTTERGAPVAARVEAAPPLRIAADAIAQISAQIIRRLEGRSTRFDIELNPHDLGKVDVRLDIDAEGRLAARLAFDNPAAALDLRGRVDELRRDLEQAGFQLSEDAFSFADREGARERREGLADDLIRSFARSAEASDEADLAAQPALRVLSRLGLDMRV